MKIDKKTDQKIDDIFYGAYTELFGLIIKYLKENNDEYKKVRKKISKILEEYPIINKVCYEKEIISLDKKNVQALIKWLKYEHEVEEIYEQELLFMGMKLANKLYKKLDLIKEDDLNLIDLLDK